MHEAAPGSARARIGWWLKSNARAAEACIDLTCVVRDPNGDSDAAACGDVRLATARSHTDIGQLREPKPYRRNAPGWLSRCRAGRTAAADAEVERASEGSRSHQDRANEDASTTAALPCLADERPRIDPVSRDSPGGHIDR